MHCWWECERRSYCGNSTAVPQKTKNRTRWSSNLVFTQREQNTHTKDMCTLVFVAALLTTAMKWKQPKCSSIDERIKKMCVCVCVCVCVCFPSGSDGKESACNTGNPGSITGSGRSPGKENGYPLSYSCLETSMDRRAYPWGHKELDMTEWLTLSFSHLHIYPRMQGTIYIYRLPRWHRGEASACPCRRCKKHGFNSWVGKVPWSRKWQPTAVFSTGKHHGQNLVGYGPWCHKE